MDVFWIEAQPWDNEANAAVTVRACTADLSPIVLMDSLEWLPIANGGPVFGTSIFQGSFTGRADATRGEMSFVAGAGEIDSWAAYSWQSRPVSIWSGVIDTTNPSAPAFPTSRTLMFQGVVEGFDPDQAAMSFSTIKPNGKLADASYAGTGGVEGDLELKGRVKPYAAGTHKNRPAVLVSAGLLLFQVHAYGAIDSFDQFREAGQLLDQTHVNHATAAALLAATVPATQIHTCLAAGMFRLGFQPYGEVTVDFDGAKPGASFSALLGDMAKDALVKCGWSSGNIDATSLAALNAAFPHPAQMFDDGGTDIIDVISGLLLPAGAYWDVDPLGVLYFGVIGTQGSADFSIGEEGLADYDLLDIDHLPSRAPFWRNRVGYGFNPSVMSFAETNIGATPEQVAMIEDVQDLTDGTTTIFFQTSAPTSGMVENDLWHDTDDGIWYKREGTAWVPKAGLGALGEALLAAVGAQAVADGKITTYYTNTTPAAPSLGDLWIKPSDNPKITRRWSGLAWDITSSIAAQVGRGPLTISVAADSTGAIEAGELPETFYYELQTVGAAIASDVTWSYRVLTGTINGFTYASGSKTMSVAAGVGSFVLSSIGADTNTVEITAVYGDVTAKATVTILKDKAAPPVTGGGGGGTTTSGSSQTSGFGNISSNSFTVITNALGVTLGSATTSFNVDVGLSMTPTTQSSDDGAIFNIELKVQRQISGVWTDQGSVQTDSSDVEADFSNPNIKYASPATFSFSLPITGLTAGSTHSVRLVARIASGTSTTRSHSVVGSVSAQ